MNKSKKKSSFAVPLLLLLVISISIGYAALSTTLNINGTSTIKKQTCSKEVLPYKTIQNAVRRILETVVEHL